MADSHAKMTQATPQEVIISIVAGLIAPLLAIFLIIQLILSIQDNQKPDTTSKLPKGHRGPHQADCSTGCAGRQRPQGREIRPGSLRRGVYACHAAGALGAPKFENKGDWGSRIAQGYDTLVKHAIEGIRQMPPRGGDGDLSDTEVARAVAYMANSAGAKFTAPEAAAPAAERCSSNRRRNNRQPPKPDPAKGKAVYDANLRSLSRHWRRGLAQTG